MTEPVPPPKKRRGPPSRGGKTPVFSVRLSPTIVRRIEDYAKAMGITRAEAVTKLVEQALAAKPKRG